jgi:hypothetical protein
VKSLLLVVILVAAVLGGYKLYDESRPAPNPSSFRDLAMNYVKKDAESQVLDAIKDVRRRRGSDEELAKAVREAEARVNTTDYSLNVQPNAPECSARLERNDSIVIWSIDATGCLANPHARFMLTFPEDVLVACNLHTPNGLSLDYEPILTPETQRDLCVRVERCRFKLGGRVYFNVGPELVGNRYKLFIEILAKVKREFIPPESFKEFMQKYSTAHESTPEVAQPQSSQQPVKPIGLETVAPSSDVRPSTQRQQQLFRLLRQQRVPYWTEINRSSK